LKMFEVFQRKVLITVATMPMSRWMPRAIVASRCSQRLGRSFHSASLRRVRWNFVGFGESGESHLHRFFSQSSSVDDQYRNRRNGLSSTKSTNPQPVISPKQSLLNLRKSTKNWLRTPLKSWTRQEVARGRYLIQGWSKLENIAQKERAINSSRVLRRWLTEHLTGNPILTDASGELLEMLHRCLDCWKQVGPGNRRTTVEVIDLLLLFQDAAVSAKGETLRPGNKAYSICLNVLANYPDHPTTCDDVFVLLNRRRGHNDQDLDLQFYNACLRVLAKCRPYDDNAPDRAEKLFQEMSTVMSPDSASFVSIMHAWASSRLPGSAERAQAILENMIESSQHNSKLDSSCFNVCIDGYGQKRAHQRRLRNYCGVCIGCTSRGSPTSNPIRFRLILQSTPGSKASIHRLRVGLKRY
jgi:hypothetical protein